MKKWFSLLCFLWGSIYMFANPFGTWKNYLAYHDITDIRKAGNIFYTLASGNLFAYNLDDNSVTTYDRVNGLNGSKITLIDWNDAAQRLLIVYDDYRFDLLDKKGNITFITDYADKALSQDKTINHIHMNANFAWVSTNFGILKVDMQRATINATYNLGFPVNYITMNNGYIFANSYQKGVWRAKITDNLQNMDNWEHIGDAKNLTPTINTEWLEIVKKVVPDGPKYNYFGNMVFKNGKLYTVPGFIGEYERPAIVQVWNGNQWIFTGEKLTERLQRWVVDFATVVVDPKDENHIVVGSRAGLYDLGLIDNTLYNAYNIDNSPLQQAATIDKSNVYDFVEVLGVAFHPTDGSLWMQNSIAATNTILRLSPEKEWQVFSKPELNVFWKNYHSMEYMRNTFFDRYGQMWFVNAYSRRPALVRYITETDQIKVYEKLMTEAGFLGEDIIRCAIEDAQGNIWVGTSNGPVYLPAEQVTGDETTFVQVKVARKDGTSFADYLLLGNDIMSIAIDGANRIWFGTNGNGAFLISNDYQDEIHHFTVNNSPLLSNVIESIAINDQTGEVFFGTDKGLCSYMSDASKPTETLDNDNFRVYPNPVTPDYHGSVTITGFTYHADVKITTLDGRLVAEGKSNGGTFTWDVNDQKGRRVASGIYLVLATDEKGSDTAVSKIAVIN